VLYRDRPNSERKKIVFVAGFMHGLAPVRYKDTEREKREKKDKRKV
jgi:hypothetical protein